MREGILLRSSEWIPLIYFVTLAVVAWLRPLPSARRWQVTIGSAAMAGAVIAVARVGGAFLRAWTPAVAILVGYYVSGRFFVEPSPGFESWLDGWDRRVLGDPSTRFASWPRPLLAYLEIVYMGCFIVVLAGFGILVAAGRAALADRYWTLVGGAELGSFVSLAFVQARPPWLVGRPAVLPDRAIHRVAFRFINAFTIRANTFPSGHVAGSLAAALALVGVLPWISALFLVLSLSIAAACVVGRYHYVVDVVAGAALALGIWVVTPS